MVLPNYGAKGMSEGADIQKTLEQQNAQNRSFAQTALINGMAQLYQHGKIEEADKLRNDINPMIGAGKDEFGNTTYSPNAFLNAKIDPYTQKRDLLEANRMRYLQSGTYPDGQIGEFYKQWNNPTQSKVAQTLQTLMPVTNINVPTRVGADANGKPIMQNIPLAALMAKEQAKRMAGQMVYGMQPNLMNRAEELYKNPTTIPPAVLPTVKNTTKYGKSR
jgi:hypothetical protein